MDQLGAIGRRCPRCSTTWPSADAVERLWAGDHTLWQDDPTEVADRLGWLDVRRRRCGRSVDRLDGLRRRGCRPTASTTCVVHGHGRLEPVPRGAGPHASRGRPGGLDARTCSTPPTRPPWRGSTASRPPTRRCSSPSSKSGTTIETRSHLAALLGRAIGDPAAVRRHHRSRQRRSADLAAERGLPGACSRTAPDIGGRYSALSLLRAGAGRAGRRRRGRPARIGRGRWPSLRRRRPGANPGLRLGAAMAAGGAGRPRQADARHRPGEIATLRALARAADRRVDRQARHRRRARWSASRSARPTSTATTACSSAIGDPRPAALDALAAAGHPVVGCRSTAARRASAPRCCCGRWPPRCAARCSASTRSTSPTWPRPRRPPAGARRAALPGDRARRRSPTLLGQVRPGDYIAIQAYVDPGDAASSTRSRTARVALRDRLAGGDHRRPRPALPALHRPAPQGRAAHRRVPPGGRATTPSDVADPRRSPTASRRSSRPRPPATCATLQRTAACGAGAASTPRRAGWEVARR